MLEQLPRRLGEVGVVLDSEGISADFETPLFVESPEVYVFVLPYLVFCISLSINPIHPRKFCKFRFCIYLLFL